MGKGWGGRGGGEGEVFPPWVPRGRGPMARMKVKEERNRTFGRGKRILGGEKRLGRDKRTFGREKGLLRGIKGLLRGIKGLFGEKKDFWEKKRLLGEKKDFLERKRTFGREKGLLGEKKPIEILRARKNFQEIPK